MKIPEKWQIPLKEDQLEDLLVLLLLHIWALKEQAVSKTTFLGNMREKGMTNKRDLYFG